MENEFQIPAKPWSDADVQMMTANADLLDADTRAELGLVPSTEVVDAPVTDVAPNVPDVVGAPEVTDGLPGNTDGTAAVVDNNDAPQA